jgi:putative NADPH-quinone reductase
MRVLVLYAHPDPGSYVAALHRATIEGLAAAGHEVDDCDLYAEGFDPILSREERLRYHDLSCNRAPVEPYIRRLEAAEGLVLVFPVWNFGLPAILKGFFDRVFLPGVSFRLENGRVWPNLHHLTSMVAVATYGGSRWRAFAMGDPPRKIVHRALRAVAPRARVSYFAAYDMNRATLARRSTFLADVGLAMRRL